MKAWAAPPLDPDETPPRFAVTPLVEGVTVVVAVAIAVGSYVVIAHSSDAHRLLAPAIVAGLLVANLVADIAVMMLVGRRIAHRRAARSAVGGGGRLHVRLVTLFSFVAAVPVLLVTIFASLLFQYGIQFWYSDRARSVFENATALTQSSYDLILQRWEEATVTMAADLSTFLHEQPIESGQFANYFAQQVYFRSLSEGALFRITGNRDIQTLAIVNPYEIDFKRQITGSAVDQLRSGHKSVIVVSGDRIQIFTPLPSTSSLFLYAARVAENPGQMTEQTHRARAAQADYRALLSRSRSLQLRFNALLLLVSLLIVGVAVWIALTVADRVVRPVGELVGAARAVAGGDLSARVADPRSRDEVGTLARAFNQMTGRLEEQNTALVTANDQLASRSALIEGVMAGVSAGVIATGEDHVIRIANRSASQLLRRDTLIDLPLAELSPDLEQLVREGRREAIVQVGSEAEGRTVAVRVARTDDWAILTFDDITQQLLDQRRAAWSDVARRIAHEIKNPLTPIQLAAERLQRRYGARIEPDDGTFARLTDTIVRQVGDLRRMVDEFSDFARMPKPSFHAEALADIARQTLFLHEVAHPAIRFTLTGDAPTLVCDRRQIGQAFTNIVKNAVEAVEAKGQGDGAVAIDIVADAGQGVVTVTVDDTGVGLPAERDRIAEPYMTTRARGTGLGLAIVKKIVEDHRGTIAFGDRPGGGTRVEMVFDARALDALDQGAEQPETAGEGQLAALTRNRI